MDEAGHGQIPYARMCHFKHCVIGIGLYCTL